MQMIGLHEAKQKFSELVRRAARGETTGITRYGKLVALIGPPRETRTDIDKIFEAMEKIRRRADPLRDTLKSLIGKGRM
jgi:prevent-host-death family protein